ncbi:membrane transporter [Diplocarpon mali]|nr:membrane transporter [Diplocarpon mali]
MTGQTSSFFMPKGMEWRSSTAFIISTVAIGMFTDLFLYGLVVPILPFILVDRIHVPPSEVQYYTSMLLACYAGAQVLFSMVAGYIADKVPSRQPPFLFGLAALFASTAMLFWGKSIPLLILARLLQGMSASVVWTIGLALIMDTVGTAKLGVTIGSIFSMISVGELAAPPLGGVLYKKGGSIAVFGIGVGLLGVDFIMRLLVIEKKTAATYGLVSESGEEDEEEGEASETSPLLSNGRTKQEELEMWRVPENQPDWIRNLPILYCLGNTRLLVSQLLAFTQATLLAMFDSTIVIEAQVLFGFDSLKAGLIFIPQILPCLVVGPLAGRAVDKYGARPIATLGLIFLSIPLVLLRIPHAGGAAEIAKMSAILSLSGIGISMISAPSIVEASYVVEQYHAANEDFFGKQGPYGQLYAMSSIAFSAGLTVGPVAAGAMRNSIGYGNMNAVMAGFCACVSLLAWRYLGTIPKKIDSI